MLARAGEGGGGPAPRQEPGRLVVVSNRVALPKRGEPAAGGLAVALRDAMKARRGLWFGWSGETPAAPEASARFRRTGSVDYALLDLSPAECRGFYAGFANATLWPLFHVRLGLVRYDRAEAETYRAVNRRFAEALAPLLAPDDTVWIHDYQLIPLAEELRARGCRQRIGFFLHIPCPPWAVFGALPHADELLRALLAHDLIGVQTARDAEGLKDCLRQGLGLMVGADGVVKGAGRRVRIAVHPIGIDTAGFARLAARAARGEEAKRLAASLGGRALVIGAERLDCTKGLPERMKGFAELLRRFPEHRDRVTFLQVTARSRDEVESYRNLRRELDSLAGRSNGDFADVDWTAVRHFARSIARNTLAGFFRLARVGLVTPLRDGMNLVAKEYVAAQDPEDPGVLVLSPFAGAAEAMTGAILVNPLDAEAMAEALRDALAMPLDERRAARGDDGASAVRDGRGLGGAVPRGPLRDQARSEAISALSDAGSGAGSHSAGASSASARRRRYSARGISTAPNRARCAVMNCVSRSRKPPSRSRATRCTSAIFDASVARLNMLSPKKAPPMRTP
jgi:trehalose 6-phosphate synthase